MSVQASVSSCINQHLWFFYLLHYYWDDNFAHSQLLRFSVKLKWGRSALWHFCISFLITGPTFLKLGMMIKEQVIFDKFYYSCSQIFIYRDVCDGGIFYIIVRTVRCPLTNFFAKNRTWTGLTAVILQPMLCMNSMEFVSWNAAIHSFRWTNNYLDVWIGSIE